ncbi:3-hydroxyacyl-CoA dehydrogenase family protein [Aeromicrobium fastidiosum]|uniref:3-hydroxyacyl-CoA dehydrogenase family protein n=1 Tax=Aeromicrobium fastidiosum TaxID=52699 RepID=A0A641AJX0_9ACTN|nr:3-hydroxyacyl-CoA dehydrogenase family protein [Aeromicrobium fastidiosum]KAA1373064.1 3-hydroxyacyl-CoA dehydrogenase family protein [Aeromicrobium fastidiosum]MBP2391047.1 3-hydroxybutyryl-CoA dehydrogenase [Aeromicrobium fastidiosum]
MALPDLVGVYGGGRMGAGIAHAFLAAGTSVVIVESDDTSAAAARGRVETSLGRAAERGLLSEQPADVLDRLVVATTAAALVDAQLVVEAVPEDPAVKARVFAAVQDAAPGAYLATNTSSLSIDGLAATLRDPSRFIGLHFFNPVPASDLVELVVGSATSPDLVTAAQGWVADLGKTAITVADSPGFASSRLGVAIALEAMRMIDEGVASAEDIDTAMTLGYRHPTGPLRTTDIVGLDVRLAIAEHLERELGPRFAPPQVLRDKVAAGDLGRKTGRGFYSW